MQALKSPDSSQARSGNLQFEQLEYPTFQHHQFSSSSIGACDVTQTNETVISDRRLKTDLPIFVKIIFNPQLSRVLVL